jgi:hypothetical protein
MNNTTHFETKLATLRDAYESLSAYADEARVKERLEEKELQITRLELQLQAAKEESALLIQARQDLEDNRPATFPQRLRLTWRILTGTPASPAQLLAEDRLRRAILTE